MSIDQRDWKLIWHSDVTPKIRHFFWRALNGHVAVSSVLYKKKLCNFPLCPICNDHEETIEHMLLLCPWVEPVWFGGLTYRVDRQQISSLHTWLRDCVIIGLNTKEERSRVFFGAYPQCLWLFWSRSWTLYPILTLIRNEERYVEECRWNWTSRNCNQAANNLASLALSRSTEVWVERPPTSLVHNRCKDGLPCPHHA
ncbi:hypothetical protein L3X38_027839 [Prunus dulcis]|uniref:Reverse transcriptase zinc-binding domain-containing protein n=1 Tax=Prunus dulcis TaxID=3755 RepID=A0AAD4VRB1_PRUDU|nr:hypothetical protein L3X38_027839 [Prunus dulcis]